MPWDKVQCYVFIKGTASKVHRKVFLAQEAKNIPIKAVCALKVITHDKFLIRNKASYSKISVYYSFIRIKLYSFAWIVKICYQYKARDMFVSAWCNIVWLRVIKSKISKVWLPRDYKILKELAATNIETNRFDSFCTEAYLGINSDNADFFWNWFFWTSNQVDFWHNDSFYV